ncbi:hypothetical protein GQ600_9594 [Phytophthora cactorum]|nr:hypothetical protein GQ600_9594 [Phytophthora cactorum]
MASGRLVGKAGLMCSCSTGVACAKMSEILASADEHAGECSFGGLADTLPITPGLFVNEVGKFLYHLPQSTQRS